METTNRLEQRGFLQSWTSSGFDDSDDVQVPFSRAMDSDADIETPHPIAQFLEKARLGTTTLAKRVAGVQNAGWDEPLYLEKADLPERSQVRLNKVYDVIGKMFGDGEACDELKAVAKRMLLDERAATIAA